jgi:hypothetical protein
MIAKNERRAATVDDCTLGQVLRTTLVSFSGCLRLQHTARWGFYLLPEGYRCWHVSHGSPLQMNGESGSEQPAQRS